MPRKRSGLIAAACAWIAVTCFSAAGAGNPEPEAIVRAVYGEYLQSRETSEGDLAKIRHYASRSLATAIDKENRCVERSHEICAIDWDVLVDAQDRDVLTDFKVDALARTGGRSVRACFKVFRNDKTPTCVSFSFIQENGAWKIDDVKDSGSGSLKQVIKEYYLKYPR